jgi:hypothetical protein
MRRARLPGIVWHDFHHLLRPVHSHTRGGRAAGGHRSGRRAARALVIVIEKEVGSRLERDEVGALAKCAVSGCCGRRGGGNDAPLPIEME